MSGKKIFNYESGFVGGTELMSMALEEKVLKHNPIAYEWNWIISPGEINIREDGKNIAWIHLGEFECDMSWICDPLVKYVIFVSYYQYQRYVEMYPQLEHSKCRVIRNAIDPIEIKHKDNKKVRLIFHPEPYRGLDILLDALKLIDDKNIELHVFGDLNTKTIDWKIEYQNKIKEMCSTDSRIYLHGRVPNNVIRSFIGTCDMFAYPSTWKETSCISLIEALSAGLYCVTNSFTSLPETGLGYVKMYPFDADIKNQAKTLSELIKAGVSEIRESKFNSEDQVRHVNNVFSWNTRKKDWEKFIQELV